MDSACGNLVGQGIHFPAPTKLQTLGRSTRKPPSNGRSRAATFKRASAERLRAYPNVCRAHAGLSHVRADPERGRAREFLQGKRLRSRNIQTCEGCGEHRSPRINQLTDQWDRYISQAFPTMNFTDPREALNLCRTTDAVVYVQDYVMVIDGFTRAGW